MTKIAAWFLAILFFSNVPSLYYGWYLMSAWTDTIQHFLGGFFVAMLMTGYLRKHFLADRKLQNIFIVVGATIFIGVVWECAEYIANQTLIEPFYRWFGIRAYFMGDLDDTIFDLVMDISGGILFALLHLVWRRNSHQGETLA